VETGERRDQWRKRPMEKRDRKETREIKGGIVQKVIDNLN
jgi:hypothetical protein